MLRFSIALLALSLVLPATAQNQNASWLETWQNPASNYYTIKQVFDSTFSEVEEEMREHRGNSMSRESEREEGAKDGTFRLFKRWEWYYAPRVGLSGDLSLPAYSYINFFAYLDQNPAAKAMHQASIANQRSSSSWNFVGPTGAPQGGGAGRLNFVRVDPTNSNIIYVGAPAGGLWKSIDAGTTWTCLTDYLPIIGCSDLVIDPLNPQVLYLGTGDSDGGDMPSLGVLKSTDGGVTWNSTGLNFNIIQQRKVARLLIHPSNPNIVYCGTSAGIYKTYDAGVNWSLMTGSGVKDMEMKPGDPNTIYACRTSFMVTTNGGATWTTIATGLPLSTQISRYAIAVTKDDPDYVYLLAGSASTQGFEGIYCSTNSGQSFTARANSPNLLGWDPNGNDSDGQAWYDLSLAVAPYDKNVLIVGGVNVWRSDDGGFSWALNAHWYGGGGVPYVHADIHALEFLDGTQSTYFVGCDGGIFKTTNDGASFDDLSHNLCIAQIYKMGQSTTDPAVVLTGHQDNGTNLKTSSGELEVLGGDGMDCFVDRTSDFTMYGSIYYGDFYKTSNGGNTWNGCTNGLSGNAGWVTPWKQDPVVASTLYCGYDQMFTSVTAAGSWTQMGTLNNSLPLTEIEIAPSNTQYLYVTNGNTIWRTKDAGGTWTNITASINTSGTGILGITVSPYDESTVWICLGGYTTNTKVYFSTDAGTTWVNASYGLPNIPANAIKAVPNTGNNLVFVGMDAGVYYRHDFSNGWQPYFSALPLAPISDFEIFEPTMTLRAATYGRGVWECAIDAALISPLALFTANQTLVCPGTTVQFTDASVNGPTSWSWSFPGGSPSSSTVQNPAVTYTTPGTYPVTLQIANANGGDIETQTGYITVSGSIMPPFFEGFTASAFLPSGWTAVNNANPNMYWERHATVGFNSVGCAWFNNHDNNAPGVTDDMRTPGINLSGYSAPQLTFDVAYARYNATRSDTLEVLVSDDCGATWTQVYIKGGTTLATAPDMTPIFTPSSGQWRSETINLPAYANTASLMISFRNHNRHGNNIYVDNINLTAAPAVAPVAAWQSFIACSMDSVHFTDVSSPAPTSWNWMFSGGSPATDTTQHPAVLWTTPGTYTVTLIAANGIGADTLTQTITVNALPVADAGQDTAYCSSTYITLNGTGGNTYTWTPAAQMYYATLQEPMVFLTASTTFTMTATDSIGCSSTDTVRVTIHPLPAFAANASQNNMCPGDTISIVCTNPLWQYSWSPAASLNTATGDSVLAFPMTSVTYSITSTDTTTGCVSSAVRSVGVYSFIPQPNVLVWGFNLTCDVGAASYQWYFNGNPITGATAQTYVATQIGMYTVEAFNLQGCSSGISSAVLVDAIPDVQVSSFSIYPNPNAGVFSITFNGEQHSDYQLDIIAADGKIVETEKLQDFSGAYRREFDLSAYGPGVYMVRITHNNVSAAYRTIVF